MVFDSLLLFTEVTSDDHEESIKEPSAILGHRSV